MPVLAALSDGGQTALIVGVFAVIAAAIPLGFGQWAKKQDWARQDVVAKRVEDAARLVVESQAAQAERDRARDELIAANNEMIAAFAERTRAMLAGIAAETKKIHRFVNSDKTDALRNLEVLHQTLLVSFKHAIELDERLGFPASKEALEQVKTVQAQIDALAETIAQRERATAVANKEDSAAAARSKAKAKATKAPAPARRRRQLVARPAPT